MQVAKTAGNVCAMELEKCLAVGLEVFLDPNPGSPNSRRYAAKVRGWERNRYLILGLVAAGPAPVIRQGKDCVIRFMHEGEVWGFTAQFAEEVLSGGYPLLQLYWPVEVARVQVRKHERVAIQTPCRVSLQDGSDIDGMIGDLSGGGCSLTIATDIEVGTTLYLSFRMPDGGNVSQRPVIVRNKKKVPGQGTKCGCQFQLAEAKDHSIELFVARKIAIERGESAPHPQVLVLSRNERDVEVAQQALAGSPFEVVEAAGILDLGYRLRTCAADGILISFEQRELSAIEVLSLIRQSPGLEEMPLFMYGGDSLRDQALSMGATLCLDDLSHARQIITYLPDRSKPTEPVTPETSPGLLNAEAELVHDNSPASDLSKEGPGAISDAGGDDDEITFEE